MTEVLKPFQTEQVLTTATIPTSISDDDKALQTFEKQKESEVPNEDQNQGAQITTIHELNNNHDLNNDNNKSTNSAPVDQEKSETMIILGSGIDARNIFSYEEAYLASKPRGSSPYRTPLAAQKPSPRPERNYDSQTESIQSDESESFKVKEPSKSLRRSTAARIHDAQVLEDRKREKQASSPKRRSTISYTPSDRLLRTTQSRIMDVKAWEAQKANAKFADDIWWEIRKPSRTVKPKRNTPSKLHEPTTAFMTQSRAKYNAVTAASPREIHKIDTNSPLLKTTTAVKVQVWKQTEIVPETPKPVLQLFSSRLGPHKVVSKLTADTTASRLQKFKTKEQRESELEEQKIHCSSNGKKVKGTSERLLELNLCIKHSTRSKFHKPMTDPREAGWRVVRNMNIIPLDEMHENLIRSGGSMTSHHQDSSSSLLKSGDQFAPLVDEDKIFHEKLNDLEPESASTLVVH